MKKTILTLFVILTVALQSVAFTPIPYSINGTELMSSTKFLPERMIPDFLDGAIWAPVAEVSSVDIVYVRSSFDENYAIACFVVHYATAVKRPAECYVITYKVKEKGILDAVLAYVDGDITLCQGGFMFSDRDYRLDAKGNKCNAYFSKFSVVRSYNAIMSNEGGDLLSEKGDVTRHYAIDENGLITVDKECTTNAIWTCEPNRSVPGRKVTPDDVEQTTMDSSRVLGPGLQVLNFYATALHQNLTEKDFDALLKWAEDTDKTIGQKYSTPLTDQVKLWRERVKYRITSEKDTGNSKNSKERGKKQGKKRGKKQVKK